MNTAGLRLASSSRSTALAVSRACPSIWSTRRRIHTRKELPYKVDDGLGNFMSAKTLHMVAVEYQQGLLDRINRECRDIEDKRKTVAQLVLDTARSQDRAVLFKYAGHALNNSFFLHCLRPPSSDAGEDVINASYLGTAIQKQFGGFNTLRALFSAAVSGMAGTGYVWLVTDAKCNLAFVPTFASGTLLIRSGTGTVEPITAPVLGEQPDVPVESESAPPRMFDASKAWDPAAPRAFHTCAASRNVYRARARSVYDPDVTSSPMPGPQDSRDITKLGDYIYPLFCISIHEHCWLLDHGIWGKDKYVKEFWTVVDWDQVVKRFETFTSPTI